MAEARRKQKEEADDSRNVDIKMASDKLINILRDAIVQDATTVRGLFGIKVFEQNYILRKLDLKKMLKSILGT